MECPTVKIYLLLSRLSEIAEGVNISYDPYSNQYVLESAVGTWIGRTLEEALDSAYVALCKDD